MTGKSESKLLSAIGGPSLHCRCSLLALLQVVLTAAECLSPAREALNVTGTTQKRVKKSQYPAHFSSWVMTMS